MEWCRERIEQNVRAAQYIEGTSSGFFSRIPITAARAALGNPTHSVSYECMVHWGTYVSRRKNKRYRGCTIPQGAHVVRCFMQAFPIVSTLVFLSLLLILVEAFDASSMSDTVPEASCTTDDFDQQEATKLKHRLANAQRATNKFERVESVSIADGAHKYVLITAREPGSSQIQHFVISRRGAAYHRNAAEPFVHRLEQSGYEDIAVEGGGRIHLDEGSKKISIFGFSYGFGQADHEISKMVVLADARFKDFEVTVSDDGY